MIRETISTTEIVTETVQDTLECEWQIPPPTDPEEGIELDLVNLSLSIAGGPATNVGKVGSAEECALTVGGEGWHYDDPSNPTRIIACPNTCTTITGAELPVVNILLGCPVEPPVLK